MSLQEKTQPEAESGRQAGNNVSDNESSDEQTRVKRPSLGPSIIQPESSRSSILYEISPTHDQWEFNAVLIEVAKRINDDDFKAMKNMYKGGIPKGILSGLRTPMELFDVMRKETYLSPVNLLQLEGLLWRIQRFDLMNMVIDFARKSKNVVYLQPASREPVNGYTHVKFHVRGKNFGQMTNQEVCYLRTIAASVVTIPASFVLIDGIDKSTSVVITLQFMNQHANRLKDMLEKREVELAVLIEFGVDFITIGENEFQIAGEKIIFSDVVIGQDIDISTRLLWEKEKTENLRKEIEKQTERCSDLEQQLSTSRQKNKAFQSLIDDMSFNKSKEPTPTFNRLVQQNFLLKPIMNSEDSEENWFKGVLGLNIVKDALIPYLKEHYAKRAEDWNTGDNHLNHLLMGENVKLRKKDGSGYIWEVNCSDCRPILTKIEKSHTRPACLTWANNEKKHDGCQDEFRLAKIYMARGNEQHKSFDDLDASTILEILRNDNSFEFGFTAISYLILFRNRLMHSRKTRITKEELDEPFAYMKKLLKYERFKELKECVSAVKKLDQLKEWNMICESNVIWKLAVALKEQVKNDEEKVLNHFLTATLTRLYKEIDKVGDISLKNVNRK